MLARIKAFLSAARNHPLWLVGGLLWPWALWFMDHRYGNRFYGWLTSEAPGRLARPGLWIAQNWFAINISAFLLWAALLSYRMWKESRPESMRASGTRLSLAAVDSPMVERGFEFYPGRRWLPPERNLRAICLR